MYIDLFMNYIYYLSKILSFKSFVYSGLVVITGSTTGGVGFSAGSGSALFVVADDDAPNGFNDDRMFVDCLYNHRDGKRRAPANRIPI